MIIVYFGRFNQTYPMVHAPCDNFLEFRMVSDVGDEGTVTAQFAVSSRHCVIQKYIIVMNHDSYKLLFEMSESCDLSDCHLGYYFVFEDKFTRIDHQYAFLHT